MAKNYIEPLKHPVKIIMSFQCLTLIDNIIIFPEPRWSNAYRCIHPFIVEWRT